MAPVAPHSVHPVVLHVRARTVGLVLGGASGWLAAISFAGQVSKYVFGHDHVFGLVALFNVDGEGNVPTWYSSVTLLGSSLLLAAIGVLRRQQRDPYARHWLGLSAIFFYASIDEAAFIHELLNPVFRARMHLPSYLYYSWVVVGGPIALAIGVAYLRFLGALPRRFRWWFVAAGAVYLGGALGVELLGSLQTVLHGTENLRYAWLTTIEETMEMAGIAMFIYALLGYLEDAFGSVELSFGDSDHSS